MTTRTCSASTSEMAASAGPARKQRTCGSYASFARTPGLDLSRSASEPCARSGLATVSAFSRNRAVPRSRAAPSTGPACSRSTGRAGSICERSSCKRGSVPLWWIVQSILPVGCSTRTAIGESAEYTGVLRIAIAGMSIRDICSPTSPVTSSGCAVRLWTSSGRHGDSHGGMRYLWRAGRRWRGWMSSWGPSTDAGQGVSGAG
jgi:hypothetical protein